MMLVNNTMMTKGHTILFSSMIIMVALMAITIITPSLTLTPWQLFQSMCPSLGTQSPQCAAFTQQQQQQALSSSPYTAGAPSSSTSPFSSLPGFPSSSSSAAP
jgi:hypothetical protein